MKDLPRTPSALELKVVGSGRAWYWTMVNQDNDDVVAQAPRPARSAEMAKSKAKVFANTLRGFSIKGLDG